MRKITALALTVVAALTASACSAGLNTESSQRSSTTTTSTTTTSTSATTRSTTSSSSTSTSSRTVVKKAPAGAIALPIPAAAREAGNFYVPEDCVVADPAKKDQPNYIEDFAAQTGLDTSLIQEKLGRGAYLIFNSTTNYIAFTLTEPLALTFSHSDVERMLAKENMNTFTWKTVATNYGSSEYIEFLSKDNVHGAYLFMRGQNSWIEHSILGADKDVVTSYITDYAAATGS